VTAPGGRREKDRWHQLADAIGASNLPASDKSVFRALLDRADYGTAVMQHRFTETQATIARKTSHSIRQVKYAVRHLELHGWLTVKGKTGPGRTLDYSLTIGASCDCTGRVHTAAARERVQPAPATGATSTPRTVATDGGNASGQAPVRTGRHREGRGERRFEREPEPKPAPKYGPEPMRLVGDSSGTDDRDDFDGWLFPISGRGEPSRGTPPGRQP